MRAILPVLFLSTLLSAAATAPAPSISETLAREKLGVTWKSFVESHPNYKLLLPVAGTDKPDPSKPNDVLGLRLTQSGETILCLFDGDKLAGFTLTRDFVKGADVKMLAEEVQLFGNKYDSDKWDAPLPPMKNYKWNNGGRTIILRVPGVGRAEAQPLARLTLLVISDDFVNNTAIQMRVSLPFEYLIEAQKGKNQADALDAARSSAPYVSDFLRLFPNADVKYTSFGPSHGFGYDAETTLYERYELTMQMPVVYDSSGCKVASYGEPKFYLWEVEKVEGRGETNNPSGELHFGSAEWKKIVSNNGDFAAIGYTMIKDKPVPGFKELHAPSKQ